MTRKQFIAEITSDLSQYDESGLIDYRSLNREIRSELKRFGNNIMVLTEKTIAIENGKAQLPEDFWRLVVAAKCDDGGYHVVEGDREHIIMSHTWKTRLEQSYVWDNNSESYNKQDFKQITEKVYFDGGAIQFRYVNPTILRLTRGMRKEVCHGSCLNLKSELTNSAPNEINIVGETLQTNFDKGYVYMQYLALPTEEDGDLSIPETQHNSLYKYLSYYCKAKIMEKIVTNGDDTGKGEMLKYFNAQADKAFPLAMTESKFEGLGRDWDVKLKNKMRRETLKYERLFPNR